MPIRRRPNGSWLIDAVHDGKRLRKTVPADTPREQRRSMELALQSEVRKRRPAARATVRDALHRWWHEHGRHLSWSSSCKVHLARWELALGAATPLPDLTRDRIAQAVASWRSELSSSSINRALAVLRHAWRRAEEVWGWTMPPVPWRRLTLAEPEPIDRSMSAETIAAWLAVWPERSRLLATMAAVTGLRRSAVLRLTTADLDWQRGVIRTLTKGRAGGKAVTVPMTEGAIAVLAAYGRLPEGRLWPLTQGQLSLDIRLARKAAGTGARMHDLRHSFAQRLEDAGEGDAISDALHHSAPGLRRRYARASTGRVRKVIEKANGR